MAEAAPFLAWSAAGFLLSFAGAALSGSPGIRGNTGKAGPVSNGHQITRRDHQAFVPRIYGQQNVGVNQVYMHTTGDSNKYLHMICDIGEGPIAGLVRSDGTRYTTTGTALPSSNPPLIYFDDILWTSFPADGPAHIEFFKGSDDQGVCSTLQAFHSAWNDAKRYTAYLYIRLKYARDITMIEPSSIMVAVDGLECTDPFDTELIDNTGFIGTTGISGGTGTLTGSVPDSWSAWMDSPGTGTISASNGIVTFGVIAGAALAFHSSTPAVSISAGSTYRVGINVISITGTVQLSVRRGDGSVVTLANQTLTIGTNVFTFTASASDAYQTLYLTLSDGSSISFSTPSIRLTSGTTTAQWTNNPAICAYDYMTTSSFRGGMGIPSAVIDESSLSDFKSYCDIKGWTSNLTINEDKPDVDHLQRILNGARASVIPSGEYLSFHYDDLNYESTVMALTAADIVVDADGAEMLDFGEPDIIDRPNTIRAKFLNGEDYKYTIDDFVHPDNDAIADDGGDVREVTIDVHGLSDLDKVQQMAYYHLERKRYNRVLSGTFGRRCLALEPGDIVTITFAPFGWTAKYFRVKTAAPQQDFTVQMTLQEESLVLYDDLYNPAAIEWFDTTLPSPIDPVLSVINVTVAEETYPERGRSRSRLIVDFEAPAIGDCPHWDHADVWVRRGASGTWEYKTKAGQNDSSSNYTLDPVEEGEVYYVKFVSVSILGTKESFDTAYSIQHTVLGVDSDPDDLSGLTAIANASGVTLFATWSGDDDAANFEIRIGASWNDGVTIMIAPAHNNALRTTINGVRPGTHIFWAAVLNNAGRYSSTPASATVTVFIPPGYTELATYGSWSWDYSTGTFSNAEATTHTFASVSHDALKCSHTSDVLTGTWQSTTYDLGAVEKVKVWGDFVMDLDSADKHWENNFPAATAWEDLGIDGKSWMEIFSLQESGKVRAKLLVKDTDSDWGSATEYEFFEMQCVEIENRYVRVEIEITDPNAGSNIYVKELNMYAYEGQT